MGFIGKQPTPAPLTASDITDGIVSTAKLGDSAVTTAKINNDAVDNTKLDLADDYAFTGAITGAGKLLGIQDNVLGSGVNTTSGTYSDVLSTTYTPSATSSYLFVLVNIIYRLHGLSTTTTPNGYCQIVSPTTTRATRFIQEKFPANSDNMKNYASFYAYWNPNTTSSVAVKLQFKEDAGGQFLLYDNLDYTRATTMTIFEVKP